MSRTRRPPRLATVKRTARVTPNMLRVTFSGNAMTGFPTDAASANIKLLLPHDDQDQATFVASLLGEGEKPIKRTYTVLEYREASNELDIDFALHENTGPATSFALNASAGDQVGIAGPSAPKLVDTTADWFLIAGDMTALPAIDSNLNQLKADATGYVVLEVQDEADQREFNLPKNLNVQWLIYPEPQSGNSQLARVVMDLPWLDGTPSIWVAGESGTVRELRSYFAKTRQVDRLNRYTSGYWQIGQDEDSFQITKRQERD